MSILTMHHGLMAGIKQGDPPGYVTIGGRLYRTVTIGTQTWLAENLDYTWTGLTIGGSGTSSTEARGNYYNNDESTYGYGGRKYGLLYNFLAVKYINDNKASICPGWHVPSSNELGVLVNASGGTSAAGKNLKSTEYWSDSAKGVDAYGLSVYPAGYYTGGFGSGVASIASITEQSDTRWNFLNFGPGAGSSVSDQVKYYQYSVRLVKDA